MSEAENIEQITEKVEKRGEDTKKCVICGISKPVKQFHITDRRKDGSPIYRAKCKECDKKHINRDISYSVERNIGYKLPNITFDKIYKQNEPIVSSILASSKSGKTTLLYNLVECVNKYYDIVLFFTVNAKAKIYKHFTQKRLIIIQDFDPRIIYALHHLNTICNGKYKFFIMMDDIIEVKYNNVVAQLFSTFRNMNFSSLHSVQYMKYMNPNARAQCHCVFFGKQNNMEQIKKTVTEYLYGFAPLMKAIPEKYASTKEQIDWISAWYQRNTQNYQFIVFDVLNDQLYKIKSDVIIR